MRITCQRFEADLERFTAGELGQVDRLACEEHVGACARCADLLTLASVPPPAAIDSTPGLAVEVLRRTSGGACARVEELLAGEADAGAAVAAEPLLAVHLAHCAACRGLSRVLAALARDLPRMAQLPPDEGFVDRVLKASLPPAARLRRWRRGTLPAWVRRPRFALEMAYALTAIFVVALSIPGTPLAAMPRQAVELVRTPPIEALEEPVRDGLAAWAASPASRRLDEGWDTTRRRVRTIFERAASWWENATEGSSSDQGKPEETS